MKKRELTREMVRHYRDAHMFLGLDFADSTLKGYVVSLATRAKLCVAGGMDETAWDITTVLNCCEPLEERRIDEIQGHLITIAYRCHVQRDGNATIAAVKEALRRFPGEREFQRIAGILGIAEEKPAQPQQLALIGD